MQDSGSRIQDIGYRIQKAVTVRIQDTDTGYRRYMMQDTGYRRQ